MHEFNKGQVVIPKDIAVKNEYCLKACGKHKLEQTVKSVSDETRVIYLPPMVKHCGLIKIKKLTFEEECEGNNLNCCAEVYCGGSVVERRET